MARRTTVRANGSRRPLATGQPGVATGSEKSGGDGAKRRHADNTIGGAPPSNAGGDGDGGGCVGGKQEAEGDGEDDEISAFVDELPEDFQDLLEDLPPSYKPVPLPLRTLDMLVMKIYKEKVFADESTHSQQAAGTAAGGAGESSFQFSGFVYDFFLLLHGFPDIAECRVADLLASVKTHMHASVHIHTFARLVGVASPPLDTDGANFFFATLATLLRNLSGSGFIETPESLYWVPLDVCLTSLELIFKSMDDKHLIRLIKDVKAMSSKIGLAGPGPAAEDGSSTEAAAKPQHTAMADVHDVLNLAMHAWELEFKRNDKQLCALFKAGDVDNDGNLSFEEFRAIIESADATRSAVEISRMFREAISASGGGTQISAGAFLEVGRQHHLSAPSSSKGIVYAVASGAFGKKPASRRQRTVVAGMGGGHTSSLFAVLKSTWTTNKAEVEAQISDAVRSCTDHAELAQRLRRFKQLLNNRQDAEAAWEAYRMLMFGVSSLSDSSNNGKG